MRWFVNIYVCLILLIPMISCNPETADTLSNSVDESRGRILIFSKTAGFRHDSIEAGQKSLTKWANQRGYSVSVTEDSLYFNPDNLARYDVVVFLNTSGAVFNETQRKAFADYIQSGGGYAGIHAASTTEYDWDWYGQLVGAWFDNHPRGVFPAEICLADPGHISTRMLPDRWVRIDEWYNFKQIPSHVNVLLEMNTDSYEGSDHQNHHPISWYHEFDSGRAFYTAFGHTDESYSERLFMKHLWGGILYAMGKNPEL